MKKRTDLSLYFPSGYTPTKSQKLALEKITEAFNSDCKTIIISAPTGTGKSFLSKTLTNTASDCPADLKEILSSHTAFVQSTHNEEVQYQHADTFLNHGSYGSFILTITKTLQDQYLKFFEDMPTCKGKSNYQSGIDERFDVETEHAVIPKRAIVTHQQSGNCPYCNARDSALASQSAILNYKMFLKLPEFSKHKNIIVCDEASELEEELVQSFSCSIDYRILSKTGVKFEKLTSENLSVASTWISSLVNKIEQRLAKLTQSKQRVISDARLLKIKTLRNIKSSLNDIAYYWFDTEYVIEKTEYGVQITPLKVNNLAQNIFKYGDKVILQSATIVDHKLFAKTLGITDYKYIEVEPTFDPEKSPIYISTKCKLNHKNLYKYLPHIVKQIEAILDEHKDEKGIIHTHSYKITQYLKTHIKSDRLIIREDDVNNEKIIQQHIQSDEPTVIVSPSLTHGVDLKDDLSRFQIIVKLPYLPLGSKRIKKMFERDKIWYESKMMSNVVQASGRSTRSIDDHSVTYILDGNMKNLLMRSGHRFPKHFLDRIM